MTVSDLHTPQSAPAPSHVLLRSTTPIDDALQVTISNQLSMQQVHPSNDPTDRHLHIPPSLQQVHLSNREDALHLSSFSSRQLHIPDPSPIDDPTYSYDTVRTKPLRTPTRTKSALHRLRTAGAGIVHKDTDDTNDDDGSIFFDERNSRIRLKRVSSTHTMMSDEMTRHRQLLWDTNPQLVGKQLKIAKPEDCSKHPVSSEGDPPNVECSLLIKKIRSIDAIASCVDGNFIFTLRWKASHLIMHRVDKSLLWKPTLSIINYDKIDMTYEEPWFYPETGDVRMLILVSGQFSNEQNLRFFPFDTDLINLDFCIELGTGDNSARLSWDPSYAKTTTTATDRYDQNLTNTSDINSLHKMVPLYVHAELKEWTIHSQLTSARRLKPFRNIVGDMTGIQVRLHVSRRYTFYVAKIYSLLWLMTCSSFYVLAMTDDSGGVKQEGFNNRLNFSAALLLTSVSFLYLCGDSIPKLSYLTFIDFMMMHSFFTQFAMMLEAYVVFLMTKHSYSAESIRLVDLYTTISIPMQYVIVQAFLIGYALSKRAQFLKKAVEIKTGVEPRLLVRTKSEEANSLTMGHWPWWHKYQIQEEQMKGERG